VVERKSAAARYGAQWFENNWSSFTFSPADFYRTLGYSMSKIIFKNGLMRRVRSDAMTEPEKEALIEYILQMTMREKSSEISIFNLLAPMGFSVSPLCHTLPNLNIPIAFMYGEYDWVSRDVADKLVLDGKV